MILTPSYDQEFCHEFGLCSDTGHLIDLIIKLPTWAQKHTTSEGDFYFIDYGKILNELPVNFKSKSKITKLLKPLIESGIIESIKVSRSLYLKPSDELVYFWKKTKVREEKEHRSKNRTFYIWNDYILKMKRIVLKIEPIRTPAISTPIIRTPVNDSQNRSKNEPKSTETWNAYSRAYLQRYHVAPLRGAKVNSLLCQFVDVVGIEQAPLVAAYYVTLNESWYQKKAHDIPTLVTNAQSIFTQWARGENKTSTDYRQTERRSSMANNVDAAIQKLQSRENQ